MILSDPPIRDQLTTDAQGRQLFLWQKWAIWLTQVYRVGVATLNNWYFSQTASKTLANDTTETSLLSTGEGLTTLPANQLQPGSRLRISLSGVMSTTGTPTLNLKVKIGGATIASTGAVATAGTISNNVWSLDFDCTCRTYGATGTLIGQGWFRYDDSTHAGTAEGIAMTATASINTTAELAIDVTATWGAASASNTITCSNAAIQILG